MGEILLIHPALRRLDIAVHTERIVVRVERKPVARYEWQVQRLRRAERHANLQALQFTLVQRDRDPMPPDQNTGLDTEPRAIVSGHLRCSRRVPHQPK